MSILSRKRDVLYLIFFLIHIPVIIFVDCYPLYPKSLIPGFMHRTRAFYNETYADQFFIAPPSWFTLYIWMEAVYHLPLSIWAIGALLRDDPKIPLHLLVFAVHAVMTTSTCVADYLSWTTLSTAQKVELGKLYVPYLALFVFMSVDMYGRLSATLDRRTPSGQKKNA